MSLGDVFSSIEEEGSHKALIKALIKRFTLSPNGWVDFDTPDALRAGSVRGDPALP